MLFLFGLSAPSVARAEGAGFHPDLTAALAELDAARGPTAHVALRRVWDTWDRADPVHVEEALARAAASARLPASTRAYAGALAAFARLRRGDVPRAERAFRELGYVGQWLVVGPFDNEGKAGLAAAHGPEAERESPLQTAKAYTGKERPVRWRAAPDAFRYGFLDFGALVRPETKVCAFAATIVSAEGRAARDVTAWVGSGGALRLFWNGREALTHDSYASHDFDRLAVSLRLEPGPNLLMLKVCGDEAAPVVSLRLADARGEPDAKIKASNDVGADVLAALVERLKRADADADAKKAKAAPLARGVQGPLQAFDALTKKPKASAADLEAHALYLDETDGDDPALHRARDLAGRAAELAPTIERLLLAARLAEDRNQAGEWIAKAEALVAASGKPHREALLARAWHRRHSPNFREALPYFDQVLALDPTNVDALRGRLELYNMAGLPRTALAMIERAVEQNPVSVGLLALYAAELRALGRASDAAEVEARYHGLRSDDASYMGKQLELALDRRERTAAIGWAERLVAAQPHDGWALGAAARAYRRLGEPDRAIATQRQALSLAPEDVGTLRALADLHGELGQRGEQIGFLRDILRIRPQDRDVREYVENLEPEKPRADEAYAWTPDRFLFLRHAPAAGQTRRTLRDLTVSTVFENGLSSKFRQLVFQPLSDAAAAQDRQYAFSYEASAQAVQLRGAKVYRKNGKIDEAIEWGEGPADDPTIAMYTSARTFYVQFPRLEAGDVVELRYRVDDVTQRNEFADYFGEITYMQGLETTLNAEYVLITPETRRVLYDAQVPGLSHEESVKGSRRVHRFFAKQVPALKPEPEMPPPPEVLGFVHVSTYESWKDLGRWYWGLVKDQFDLDDDTRKLARKITEGKKTEREKVEAVYDWVIQNTRYVALEFGIYGYKPRRCVQTVNRGWGDCKDKATVIVTLLKELGIPSTLVVVRTQLRGSFRSKLPSFAPFDHAIAYVPSLGLYLDGTAEHTGIGELPKMDLGALGLLVSEGDTKLTELPHADSEKNFVRRGVTARLAPSGEAKMEISYATGGYVSADWRRRYHAAATRKDRVNSDLGGEYPGFEIAEGAQGIVTSDLENARVPVSIQVRGTAPAFARKEGDELSMAVTSSLRLTPTFASLSSRTQDLLVQGFSTTEEEVVIDLPPKAEVVSAPIPARGETRFGSYLVEVSKDKDRISVKSRVAVKVNRVVPRDYADWKRFCEDVDRALSPRLVVRP